MSECKFLKARYFTTVNFTDFYTYAAKKYQLFLKRRIINELRIIFFTLRKHKVVKKDFSKTVKCVIIYSKSVL